MDGVVAPVDHTKCSAFFTFNNTVSKEHIVESCGTIAGAASSAVITGNETAEHPKVSLCLIV